MEGFIWNPETSQFRAELANGEAYIDYRDRPGEVLDLTYIYVSPDQRGKGIEDDLVRYALGYARESGKKVTPSCPWIGYWTTQHPEYADLLEPG